MAVGLARLLGSLPGLVWWVPGMALVLLFSPVLSAPREGYNNPPISGENLIGLSRARRPHNAIFVNFEDEEVPKQPLEAAAQTWRRVCTNPVDRKVEEELRKASPALRPAPGAPASVLASRVYPAAPCSWLWGWLHRPFPIP